MSLIEANVAKSTESENDVTGSNENQLSENNSVKTVVTTNELLADVSRFKAPGINFNAKLIGVEEVHSARGDKMCQDSMAKLKMAVKQTGQHKQKIIINVSLEGIQIFDHRTQAINHTHAVHKISFILRDINDKRAFGYVYGEGDGKHKFFAIKTEKAAEALVLTLRDLFQVVYKMKKQEVEKAKHKIEEPSKEADQGDKKTEAPDENNSAAADQEPVNSQPVVSEASDLLCLETELETIEKRLEQIDTMEELFKELEAPPVTKSSSWANELGSLSDGVQSQSQSMFSLGGVPFSTNQAFPPLSSPQMQFGAQPFGMLNPAAAGGYGMQQPFAAPPNPYQLPPVPARTGMGFPGQPNPYPGTPFPGSQPYFPRSPHMATNMPMFQPSVTVTPANDPFGANLFATSDSAFEESILKPARIDSASPTPESEVQKSKDFFGDLVDIGAKTKASKSPKELFTDLSAPEKRPLNQMKVERVASPKPGSPFGSQASEAFGESSSFDNFPAHDFFFITSDPYASDLFASSNSTSQDDMFGLDVFGDDTYLSKPLPQIPPPPLPNGSIIGSVPPADYKCIPLPPPRSSCNAHIPPLPPRPKSTSSDITLSSRSSSSSLSDSQSVGQHQMPPFPYCTKTDCNTIPVPRPRPKPAHTVIVDCHNIEINHNHAELNLHNGSVLCNKRFTIEDNVGSNPQSSSFSHTSAKSKFKESHLNGNSKVLPSCVQNTCIVMDPFLATDPFALEDQFMQMDPFVGDPFTADPFSGSCSMQQFTKSDPFISVVDSQEAGIDCVCDPFAIFDKTFDNETFKFERSARNSKLKVVG